MSHQEVLIDDSKELAAVPSHPRVLHKKADNTVVIAAAAEQSAFKDFTCWQAIKRFKRLFAFGASISLGAMYIGYCSTAIGAIVANESFVQQFGTVHATDGSLELDAQALSIWAAVQSVAQIVAQGVCPLVIDRFGRKMAMYGLTVYLFAGIMVEIFAKSWQVFTLAKVLTNFASGWMGPAIMSYMSEIAMPQFRGVMLSCFALSMAIGQFATAIANQIVASSSSPGQYRHVFYSEFAILGIWIFPCVIVPESPVWLITKNREEQAKKALNFLVGSPEGWDLEHEFSVVRSEVRLSEAVTASYSDNDWKAFFRWGNFRRAIAASLPFAGQQFSGVPYFFGYTTYFFQIAGLANPFLANTILNCIYCVSLFASFFLVEKLGRRAMVIYGMIVLGVINVLIGGLGFDTNGSQSARGAALVALASIWECVYSLSMAPLGWVCLVEVSSVRMRAKTATFGVIVNSVLGLVFGYIVPLLLSNQDAGWGQKIGLLFAGLSFAFVIPVWFLYPETKGRNYVEIDELYERGTAPWRFAKTETSIQENGQQGA